MTPKITITESVVRFYVDYKEYNFKVYHNLPDTFGLSFEDAFNSWLYRTRSFTGKSLCKYIMSKNSEYICMTEEQFNRLNQ